jgi:hypothetical protein
MRSYRPLSFHFALALILAGTGCAARRTSSLPSGNVVLDVIHAYGQGPHGSEVATASKRPVGAAIATVETDADESAYIHCITMLLYNRNFAELEREAQDARVGKGRFVGGVWKLFDFYVAVSGSPLAGNYQEKDFVGLNLLLREWGAAEPQSASAQIALAEMYTNWGAHARGNGSADTVTQDGWKFYKLRAEISKGILVKAAQLDEKCPYWYEAMQHVAMAEGWDKSQARDLLEQAVQFEPGFYHFYREYALYLEPRWYGEAGEAGSFAKEISNRVGGEEGAFLYFEVASLLTCQCSADPTEMANLSWPKIKEGYAALNRLYGVSDLKLNRFAYMAYLAGDEDAAREAFAKIGDRWVPEPWGTSKEQFENAKAWAARGRPVG